MKLNIKKLKSSKNILTEQQLSNQQFKSPKVTIVLTKELKTPSPNVNLYKKNIAKKEHSSSKLTNMLFSIKTTKMKRTHHKNLNIPQGFVAQSAQLTCSACKDCCNTCYACYYNDLNEQKIAHLNIKTEKNLKKVSLKAIGISFANLFKPNVKIKNLNFLN